LQETAPISTSTSEADTAARGTGNTLQDREEEDGMTGHNEQPELEEHCASHQADGRSGQFDENAHVDVTMQAAKYGIEFPPNPAHPALALKSNVAVRVENSEAAVEERRNATLLPLLRGQQQETRDHPCRHETTGK
jgi:hypothetical protein